jgi:hypothetical protein
VEEVFYYPLSIIPDSIGSEIDPRSSMSNAANTKFSDERPRLIEGEDYYFESGLMVLTARYLLRRGYCCGNGCRHCPHPKEHQNSRLEKKDV